MTPENSYRGQLLVAAPQLLDPNFHRTVVLIVEYGEEGTLGLVLNRPSDTTVKELWDQIGEGDCSSEQPLFVGGPVEGPVMALHTHEPLGDSAVTEGLFFCVQKEYITELIEKDEGSYRLFVGHAGWSPGQLEAEMKEGSWLLLPATAELIFYKGEDLWDKVRADLSNSSLIARLGIKHSPNNPRLN